MLSNVPQFIDIEDRIVGPLTAKQLGWVALGGVILVGLWFTLRLLAFIFVAIFIILLFGGLAFYRPYNQSLLNFFMSSVSFVFKSKMYIWKRLPDSSQKNPFLSEKNLPSRKKLPVTPKKKELNEKKLEEISKLLDIK
jgi:hypothetical protein